jgi:hypothetical protein
MHFILRKWKLFLLVLLLLLTLIAAGMLVLQSGRSTPEPGLSVFVLQKHFPGGKIYL